MAVPRSADFLKVLTLFGIHFLLSDPLSSLVLKNPRAPTTTSITFVFALKSPNISLAKSWHPYCFPFSLLSRLLSPGAAMSRRGLCCCSYHGQLHVCQAQGKISWYFHFFILSYACRAMLVPLATKFQMNNPGQCVVPLFVICLGKHAAATYYVFYTLLAFSTHPARHWQVLMFDIALITFVLNAWSCAAVLLLSLSLSLLLLHNPLRFFLWEFSAMSQQQSYSLKTSHFPQDMGSTKDGWQLCASKNIW